jgi:hypothetical protein
MAQIASTKVQELFHKNHIPHIYLNAQHPAVRLVDNKVMDVALKILKKVALGVAIAVTFTATVLSGASQIPFIFVGVCLAVSALSHLILGKMHRLFSPEALEIHKKQAQALVESYKYLDEVATFSENLEDDKAIKATFIKPLSILIDKFTVADLISYKILSSEDLVEAFCLETKHQDFFESLKLYQKITAPLRKKGQVDTDFGDKVKKIMETKAQQVRLPLLLPLPYETLKITCLSDLLAFVKTHEKQLKALQEGLKSGFVEDTDGLLKQIENWFKFTNALTSKKSMERKYKPILNIYTMKESCEKSMDALYAGNELHDAVESKQKEFIASLELIYINKKQRDASIVKEFEERIAPIDKRKEEELSEEDQKILKAFEKIRDIKLKESLKLAQEEMKTFVERFVGEDFIALNRELDAEKKRVNTQKVKALEALDQQLKPLKDTDSLFGHTQSQKITQLLELTQQIRDIIAAKP